jgi:photosystem II stability/assembly factor-like uncharacterized protein
VGKYRGYWILANASGQFFGIGADASKPVWVEINVSGEAPYEGGYPLWSNACSAEWKSGAGPLPCPGVEGDRKGFILPLNYSHLEDGTMGPLPTLLMSPENKYNGYIQGIFPAFTVQPRDHFVTGTGCEYGYNCYVTFRLDYMTANGGIFNFWSWREQNDKKNYTANIDLSPLAGRSVRFILTILATGSATGDRVRWGGPTIVRVEGTTPPPTTPAPPTANWPAYINSTYGFNFKYPPGSERFFETTNSILINMPIAPGTNLAEKYLQVSVNENINPCQSPLSDTSRPGSPTETVVFNGIPFFKQMGGDAGMSQLHEWVGYSTLKNNACISMDFVLHSIAPGAFATPPPEFDKAAESAVFTQVMSTFAWNAPPTPTATPTPTSTLAPPTVAPPPVVSSPQIRKLFMMDSANGWAIGNSYVLRTTDGGATWYNVSISITGISSIKNGFFQNASKGWVIATTFTDVERTYLFRTTNGGSTWTTYTIPFNGGYMQFLNDTNGFVLAGDLIGMQKHPVSLYQTSDGGATWTLKFAHDPNQPTNGLPVSGHKNGMTFRDTTRGWVGGDVPISGAVYLYRTDNGGVTWSQQPMAVPAGYESAYVTTTAPTFFGANDAILPVWMTIGTGMRDLFLYVTHDGGMTWSRSSAFARNGDFVSFPSLRDALSYDRADVFHVTNDAGNSWRTVTPNVLFSRLAYQIFDLDFISTTTGWFTIGQQDGSSSLYRTSDGGATWTLLFGNPPVPQPLPDLTITGMSIRLQNPSCLLPGDPLGVSLGIQNIGQAAAGTFTVNVNGLQQTVETLGVGETLPLFFPNSTNPVTATVDSSGAVTESNENNNSRSEMVPVPTPPLPCPTNTPTGPQDFSTFGQSIVEALNSHDFELAKSRMGQSFGFGFWQSQGFSRTPDLAIQQLQNSYIGPNTHLTPDPSKDLVALLGGLNPYSIMGLDPSNSQAFFVSGWGLDGKSEAILYVTRFASGNLYWHSVLIAPTGFAPPITLTGPYAVVRVAPNDVLNIRSSAGASNSIIGYYPPDATDVMRTGASTSADGAVWVEVRRADGLTGWVNSDYLTEYVSTSTFCADARIPQLIEQLKQSMIQSNGDQFASLIGSKHGAAINFWRDAPPVNYTTTTARSIFTDTLIHDWGAGPAAGPSGVSGTFAQIVQPDMLDVFNSSYQLGCDDPSHAAMFVNPWPHTNIHYYSILKPPSNNIFDWKVWLIGFEYVEGVPYLYGTIHYVWEP